MTTPTTAPSLALAALEEIYAYFVDRQDVIDGDYGQPAPNEEMRMMAECDTLRAALQADPVAVPVALIIHHAEKLTRMEITEEGMFLGVGTHKLYTAPPAAAPGDFDAGIDFIVRNKNALLRMCAGPSEAYVVEQTVAMLAAAPRPAAEAAAKGAMDEEIVERAQQAFWPVYFEAKRTHGKNCFGTGMRAALTAALSLQDRTL